VAGRVAVSFGSISVGSGADSMAISADADFGVAAGAATITHFAICDAASGGNMLVSNPLTGGSKTIGAGTSVKFASGALVASVD